MNPTNTPKGPSQDWEGPFSMRLDQDVGEYRDIAAPHWTP